MPARRPSRPTPFRRRRGPRPAGLRDDRQRQDRRVSAADPAPADGPAPRHDARAGPDADARAGGADSRGPQRPRRAHAADGAPRCSAASAWGRRSTPSAAASTSSSARRAGCSITSARRTRSSRASSISCSTKPTACSTWASCPTSAAILRHMPREAADAVLQRDDAAADRGAVARDAAQSGDDQPRAPVGAGRPASRRRCIRCRSSSRRRCWSRLLEKGEIATRWCSRGRSIAPTGSREHLARARGSRSERIHGNRSQAQRTEALAGFKSGKYRVLVATDIAARGIDVTRARPRR